MGKRINWTDIYSFYISSDSITLRNAAQRFGVSYDVVRQKASDEKWRQKKKNTRQIAIRIVEQELGMRIAQIKKKHIKLAQTLQTQGMKSMIKKDISPTSARDIKSWISSGFKMERNARGMDQHTQQKLEPNNHIDKENVLGDGTHNDKNE